MFQALRRAGGSLVVTIRKIFIGKNGLSDGSTVELRLFGKKLMVEAPAKPHYKLADLMAEMPARLPAVKGWDEMPAAGREQG